MINFGCKKCGYPNVREKRDGRLHCMACGSVFEKDVETNEERDARILYLSRLDDAEKQLRLSPPRFDDAEDLFRDFIKHYPTSCDGYWGLVRARYGIKFEDDISGRQIPSCYKSSYEDFRRDHDYMKALELSEGKGNLHDRYVADAELFAGVCKEWREEASKYEYDVFISFKASDDETGEATADLEAMRDLYTYLVEEGYRVFFSPMSMKRYSGKHYDAYIFNALQQSKCMIVYGSKPEYYTTTWVQNEWTRFLRMESLGEKKKGSCIVLYDGFNPKELPHDLSAIQAINASKDNRNFYIDVLSAIKRSVEEKKDKHPTKVDTIERKKSEAEERKRLRNARWNSFLISMKRFFVSVFIIAIILGIAFGIYYKIGMNKVEKTNQLIESMPYFDSAEDCNLYADTLFEAYEKYNKLADWQKEKVKDAHFVSDNMKFYSEYIMTELSNKAEAVNIESVKTTDALLVAVNFYQSLSPAFKDYVKGSESWHKYSTMCDAYAKVHQTISLINEVNGDPLNNQEKINEIQTLYHSLGQNYTELVYNYDLVSGFTDKIALYELFAFEQLEGGTYSIKIKNPESLSGVVELPSKYNGQAVTHIPEGAFKNCKNVTSIVVPDSVVEIGVGAFQGCNRLEEITLPFTGKNAKATAYEAVFGYIFGYSTQSEDSGKQDYSTDFKNTKTGSVDGATWQYSSYNGKKYSSVYAHYALVSYFYYIPTSLKAVTITSQSEAKPAAFNGCNKIEHITYNKTVENVGNSLCQNCTSLLSFNSDTRGEIIFDSLCVTIGDSAFKNCELITSLTLSDETQFIYANAFSGCVSISELTLPESIVNIYDYAFQDLKLIEDISIPDNVILIGQGAFKGCNSVKSLKIPFVGKNREAKAHEAVLGYIFGYSTQSEDSGKQDYGTDFKNTKTGSVDGATWQYSSYSGKKYSSVYAHYALVSYFYHIPKALTNVVVTDQKNVNIAAFNECEYIVSIIYTKGIDSIGMAAFQNCTNLTRINSNDPNCIDLTGESKSIAPYAFKNCNLITTVITPKNISSIGEYAFENTAITSFVVPDTVDSIGVGAFKGCKELKEITLPFIGKSKDALYYNAVLGYIFGYEQKDHNSGYELSNTFKNTIYHEIPNGTIWQYSCKRGSLGNSSFFYYIPESLIKVTITEQTEIPTAAFNGCTMLTEIVFEKEIESQGECAFQNCTATIVDGIKE